MAILAWKHRTTEREAQHAIRGFLTDAGHSHYVTWHEFQFGSMIGWGTILDLDGDIDADFVTIRRLQGAIAGVALIRIEKILESLFSGGKLISPRQLDQAN